MLLIMPNPINSFFLLCEPSSCPFRIRVSGSPLFDLQLASWSYLLSWTVLALWVTDLGLFTSNFIVSLGAKLLTIRTNGIALSSAYCSFVIVEANFKFTASVRGGAFNLIVTTAYFRFTSVWLWAAIILVVISCAFDLIFSAFEGNGAGVWAIMFTTIIIGNLLFKTFRCSRAIIFVMIVVAGQFTLWARAVIFICCRASGIRIHTFTLTCKFAALSIVTTFTNTIRIIAALHRIWISSTGSLCSLGVCQHQWHK